MASKINVEFESNPKKQKTHENSSESQNKKIKVEPKRYAKHEKIPPDSVRYDRLDHLVDTDDSAHSMRCKLSGCKSKTHVLCPKCRVHLCVTSKRSCFKKFHINPSVFL